MNMNEIFVSFQEECWEKHVRAGGGDFCNHPSTGWLTSESAEVTNDPIRDVGDLDEAGIVGLGNQRAVWHRQA